MKAVLPVPQVFGFRESYYSGIHIRDPQCTVTVKQQICQAFSHDRRKLAFRAASRKWNRPHLSPAVVRKPQAPVFRLCQCCDSGSNRATELEASRTPRQEGDPPDGRDPERALAVDEEIPDHFTRKIPVAPDADPSTALP